MMNRLNRILHNKRIKLFWFAANFMRYAVPKRFLQRKLAKTLAEAKSRPDRDYIFERVDYYCKLLEGCHTQVTRRLPHPRCHADRFSRRPVPRFRRRGVHRCNGDLSPHNSWLKRGRKPHRYRLQAQCGSLTGGMLCARA